MPSRNGPCRTSGWLGCSHDRRVPLDIYKVLLFHEKLQPKELEVTVEARVEAVLEFTGLKRK